MVKRIVWNLFVIGGTLLLSFALFLGETTPKTMVTATPTANLGSNFTPIEYPVVFQTGFGLGCTLEKPCFLFNWGTTKSLVVAPEIGRIKESEIPQYTAVYIGKYDRVIHHAVGVSFTLKEEGILEIKDSSGGAWGIDGDNDLYLILNTPESLKKFQDFFKKKR